MNIAIIPARGGSKRIKKKNIKLFLDNPIIYYSITVAKKTNLFDKIVVSTDDTDIKELSLQLGAEVPFVREKKLSDDLTPTLPVICDTILKCKKFGYKFKNVCCIYPTAPFIRVEDITNTFNLLKENYDKFYFPVTEFPSSIYRSFTLKKNNEVSLLYPENEQKRTQDITKVFHDASQFYWASVNTWLNSKGIHSNGIGYKIPNWRVVDFDTIEDWKRAEVIAESIDS